MMSSFDFSSYSVLVTGGSNGIGLAIAKAFRNADASVTITGTKSAAEQYGNDLSAFAYRQTLMENTDSVEALIAGTDRVDILINNAGTFVSSPEGPTPADFELNLAVNLNSVFRLCHGLQGELRRRPGNIINIASMYSYFGSPTGPGYGASKSAIVNLTKSLAALYAPGGVRVNAIAPGWIETNLTEGLQVQERRNRQILDRTPMARWGRPDEIAGTALYLASSELAGFVTGVTIPVDGGYSAV